MFLSGKLSDISDRLSVKLTNFLKEVFSIFHKHMVYNNMGR